ncbi:uncharacterized protein LOC120079148 [Benincasa hispida]|uniref:uncharacterized protein LOC120079148 n=1 Tax=Benincasa hispida TaxID=102211 RepID=UPI001901F4C9|nr:uncharacterized protein LOC120079148 [Benincasa hispida]
MEFAYNINYKATIGMLPFEALYRKSCKSSICWDEVGQRKLLGPELVQIINEAIQNIRACMRTTQRKQKSYVDVRCKDLQFETGVKMSLKVAPMRGVLRFGRKGKLSSQFIGLFEVTDPSHVVDYEPLWLNEILSYEEKPVEVLTRDVKMLHSREITLVKVMWQNHQLKEATC